MPIVKSLNEVSQKREEAKSARRDAENKICRTLRQGGFTRVAEIDVGEASFTVKLTVGMIERTTLDEFDTLFDDFRISGVGQSDDSNAGLELYFRPDET